MENAAVILEHASCEMSVMPIAEGDMKGKFLAVFQYDVQSSYVAYSVGETPWGPFDTQCKVYYCKEKYIYAILSILIMRRPIPIYQNRSPYWYHIM